MSNNFLFLFFFFFSSRRRHTRCYRDWSSDVCSSDLRRQDAELRMAGARERLGSCKLLFPEIDLRLIPELDPSVAERLIEADAGGDRSRMAELELLHDPRDGGGLERLLEDRQHLQLVLLADALDVLEHRR